MVRGLTHIAFNRLDLVMTGVSGIVDVVVGTTLGTSDHCFVSCVLPVCWAVCAGVQCQKYNLFKSLYQLGQCPQCSQEFHMEHDFEVS